MGTIGGTLTSGIKDIAALLPLLGTEQCEDQVGSALTKGFIYAAATPLSIFGSLGLALAGIKTLVAGCVIHKRDILGARILADMGFKPKGTSLPFIMLDDDDKDQQYLVERRLDDLSLLKELHMDVDTLRGVTVTCKSAEWNASMMLLTLGSCLLSITPYVYINISGNSTLNLQARWTFPTLRAVGGFLTATMMQLVIQNRVITLTKRWLGQRIEPESQLDQPQRDLEEGLDPVFCDENSVFTWCCLALLLGGILAIVVGYVGCFSVVQSAQTFAGPLSWLCIEVGLSAFRMVLWGRSRSWDDAPQLKIILPLERHAPLPTCMKYDDEILRDKILPLTSASEFLKSITAFVGPNVVEYFNHPDLELYYTMTRKPIVHAPDQAATPTDRVLYITIFHQKERTAWVYNGHQFYSTATELVADPDHSEIKLDEPVEVSYNHPVDANIQAMLARHYQTITNGLSFVTSDGSTIRYFTITTRWTMQEKDTIASNVHIIAEKDTDPSFKDDCLFIGQGRLDRIRRSLISNRQKWVEDYMKWVLEIMEESIPIGKDMLHRKMDSKVGKYDQTSKIGESKDGDLEKLVTETIFMIERYHMEMLLVKEVRGWERELVHQMQPLFNGVNGTLVKKHLVTAWSRNCQRRLKAEMDAMDTRMNAAKERIHLGGVLAERWKEKHQEIHEEWESVLKLYVRNPGSQSLPPSPPSISLTQHLESQLRRTNSASLWLDLGEGTRNRCERRQQEMEVRLRKEVEDIKSRLKRRLEDCDQLWIDRTLFEFRHSRLKWRVLNESIRRYVDELSRPSDITHITCHCSNQADVAWVFERIRSMPQVTSVHLELHYEDEFQDLTPFLENNDRLLSITGNGDPSQIQDFLDHNNSRSKATTIPPLSRTVISFAYLLCGQGEFAKISFFGPTSGKVILRLEHCSDYPGTTVTILQGEDRKLQLGEVPKGCWTIDEITLHSRQPGDSLSVSFEPDERNELTLTCNINRNYWGAQYKIRDIQLEKST